MKTTRLNPAQQGWYFFAPCLDSVRPASKRETISSRGIFLNSLNYCISEQFEKGHFLPVSIDLMGRPRPHLAHENTGLWFVGLGQ